MTSAAAGALQEVYLEVLRRLLEVHSQLVRSSSVRRCCSCSRGWRPPWRQRSWLRQQQEAAAAQLQEMVHQQQQRVWMYQMLAAAWMQAAAAAAVRIVGMAAAGAAAAAEGYGLSCSGL
jgi:hypothetical protein